MKIPFKVRRLGCDLFGHTRGANPAKISYSTYYSYMSYTCERCEESGTDIYPVGLTILPAWWRTPQEEDDNGH